MARWAMILRRIIRSSNFSLGWDSEDFQLGRVMIVLIFLKDHSFYLLNKTNCCQGRSKSGNSRSSREAISVDQVGDAVWN